MTHDAIVRSQHDILRTGQISSVDVAAFIRDEKKIIGKVQSGSSFDHSDGALQLPGCFLVVGHDVNVDLLVLAVDRQSLTIGREFDQISIEIAAVLVRLGLDVGYVRFQALPLFRVVQIEDDGSTIAQRDRQPVA